MHATKHPLRDWIFAIDSMMAARKGISAMQLSKTLGVQYRTAWHMLYRIREVCGRGEFTLYTIVEVDETHVGGREGNKHASKKLNQGHGTGGLDHRGQCPRTGRQGQAPYPYGCRGGLCCPARHFTHATVNHEQGEYVRGDVHTNSIESVWVVLKRGIVGWCLSYAALVAHNGLSAQSVPV